MRGPHDGAQVVRIFNAIEKDEETRALHEVVEAAIFLRSAERHHT